MTTALDKTLKRELRIDGRSFVVTLSPESLKLTLKGKRHGLELKWEELVSGEAALAVALNASVGKFSAKPTAAAVTAAPPKRPQRRQSPKRRA